MLSLVCRRLVQAARRVAQLARARAEDCLVGRGLRACVLSVRDPPNDALRPAALLAVLAGERAMRREERRERRRGRGCAGEQAERPMHACLLRRVLARSSARRGVSGLPVWLPYRYRLRLGP